MPELPTKDGRRRVIIEGVTPQVDGGRFPVKRTAGEELTVSADVTADGHEVLAAVVRYRPADATEWAEAAMTPVGSLSVFLGRRKTTKFLEDGVVSHGGDVQVLCEGHLAG